MKSLLPLAVALLVAAPLAWADDKGHDHMASRNGQPQPHDMAAMSAEDLAKLDANKNGQLGRTGLPEEYHHLVRLLDGYSNTRDHAAGTLASFLVDGDFVDVQSLAPLPVPLGSIDFLVATRLPRG